MRRLMLMLIAGVLTAACAGSPAPTTQPGAAPPPAPAPPAGDPTTRPTATATAPAPAGPATAVPTGLDFSLPGVTGGTVDGAELAGRHLVLWFWAPW
jgi:hypothetical protein